MKPIFLIAMVAVIAASPSFFSETPAPASLPVFRASHQPSDDGREALLKTPPEVESSPSPLEETQAAAEITSPRVQVAKQKQEIEQLATMNSDLVKQLQARQMQVSAPATPIKAQSYPEVRTTYGAVYSSCGPAGCGVPQYSSSPRRRFFRR